jgi:hypothetical protein
MIEQVKSLCEQEAVRVEAMEGLCPLYYHYDGQHAPQGAAIFIKADPIEIRAAYYGELGGTWDIDDWYGRRFAIPIPPNATKAAIAEYLREEDTHALIAEIVACYREEYRFGELYWTWDDAPVFEIPVELDTAAVFSTRDFLDSLAQDFDRPWSARQKWVAMSCPLRTTSNLTACAKRSAQTQKKRPRSLTT